MTADNKHNHNDDSLEQKVKEKDPNQDIEPQKESDTKPQQNKDGK
ncbi:hypothetical protein [Oceanobacillus rekensis]|nr:hypothetical protein [Oceanobacillus rekensis]